MDMTNTCVVCGNDLPLDKFAEKRRQCRSCVYKRKLSKVREWRENNPDRVKELARDSRRGRYLVARTKAVEFLGHKCFECDWSDASALVIDHVSGGGTAERSTKDRVSFVMEVADGKHQDAQLLCLNHHALKTACEATVRAHLRSSDE